MATSKPSLPKAKNILTIRPVSRLLSLPRELRTKIYEYALFEPILWKRRHRPSCLLYRPGECWEMPAYCFSKFNHGDHFTQSRLERSAGIPHAKCCIDCQRTCLGRPGMGLIRTCRTVYNEAMNIFWRDNTFCFQTWDDLEDVLENKTFHSVKQIRHLSLITDGSSTARYGGSKFFIELLHRLPRIEAIELPVAALVPNHLVRLLLCRSLVTVKASNLSRVSVWAGMLPNHRDEDSILMFCLTREIRLPHRQRRNDPCDGCKELLYFQDACNACRSYLREQAEALAEWKDNMRIDDVVSQAEADIQRQLSENVPACPVSGSRTYTAELQDGTTQDVVVLGLPILSRTKRRKYIMKVARQACSNGQKIRSQGFVEEDPDVFVRHVGRTAKKPGMRQGPKSTLRKPLKAEDPKKDILAERENKKAWEAHFEAVANHNIKKKREKALAQAMEELKLQKKDVRKRVNRSRPI